jgi:hypothetical protein
MTDPDPDIAKLAEVVIRLQEHVADLQRATIVLLNNQLRQPRPFPPLALVGNPKVRSPATPPEIEPIPPVGECDFLLASG